VPLVIDASIAVKFVVREIGSDAARRLIEIPDPLVAPDWLLVEAASAMWRKVKRSELLLIHAERNLDELPAFFEKLYPSRDLVADALHWAFRLRHPVYDCLYLALALREQCQLFTADEKFHRALVRGGFEERSSLLQ
jgi:predicted nucleic acid-binding protein